MASSISNQNAPASASTQTLGEADYLNLLVTQMSSQDPLNPQSDTEFAAQLAQFSALQSAQTMQANMATLQANSMIGETVSVNPSSGGSVTGTVSGVIMQTGTPEIMINGQPYQLSQVTSFSSTAPTTTTPAAPTTPTTPIAPKTSTTPTSLHGLPASNQRNSSTTQ